MFDHVKIGVSDFAARKAFYLAALKPLGVYGGAEGEPTYHAAFVIGPDGHDIEAVCQEPGA